MIIVRMINIIFKIIYISKHFILFYFFEPLTIFILFYFFEHLTIFIYFIFLKI